MRTRIQTGHALLCNIVSVCGKWMFRPNTYVIVDGIHSHILYLINLAMSLRSPMSSLYPAGSPIVSPARSKIVKVIAADKILTDFGHTGPKRTFRDFSDYCCSLTTRDTKLAFYPYLDWHLGYVKSEGELPRSTHWSSGPRGAKDLKKALRKSFGQYFRYLWSYLKSESRFQILVTRAFKWGTLTQNR